MNALPERIEKKIEPCPESGCWLWVGARVAGGYGYVYWRGRPRNAHRVIYEILRGPIPPMRQIDHLCRVRACVNPAHLEPVTCRTNLVRGVGFIAKNAAKTHCPSGHPLASANLYTTRSGGRRCKACNLAVVKRRISEDSAAVRALLALGIACVRLDVARRSWKKALHVRVPGGYKDRAGVA